MPTRLQRVAPERRATIPGGHPAIPTCQESGFAHAGACGRARRWTVWGVAWRIPKRRRVKHVANIAHNVKVHALAIPAALNEGANTSSAWRPIFQHEKGNHRIELQGTPLSHAEIASA